MAYFICLYLQYYMSDTFENDLSYTPKDQFIGAWMCMVRVSLLFKSRACQSMSSMFYKTLGVLITLRAPVAHPTFVNYVRPYPLSK